MENPLVVIVSAKTGMPVRPPATSRYLPLHSGDPKTNCSCSKYYLQMSWPLFRAVPSAEGSETWELPFLLQFSSPLQSWARASQRQSHFKILNTHPRPHHLSSSDSVLQRLFSCSYRSLPGFSFLLTQVGADDALARPDVVSLGGTHEGMGNSCTHSGRSNNGRA